MVNNLDELIKEVQGLSVYTKQEREDWINRIKSGDVEAIEEAKKIKKGLPVKYTPKTAYKVYKREIPQSGKSLEDISSEISKVAEEYHIPEEDVKELYEEAEHLSEEQVEDLKSKESSIYWSAIEENRKMMQDFKPEFLPAYLHNKKIIEEYQKRDYNKYKEDLKKYLFGKMLMNYKSAQKLQKEKEKKEVIEKLKKDKEFETALRFAEAGWGKHRIMTTTKWLGREALDILPKLSFSPTGFIELGKEVITGKKSIKVGEKIIKKNEKELEELAETYLTLKPKLKEIDKITTKDVLKGSAVATVEAVPLIGKKVSEKLFKKDTKTELLTSSLPTELAEDIAGGVLFLKGVKGGEKLAEKLLGSKGKLTYKEIEKVGSGVLLYLAGKDLYESAKQSIEENNPEKFLETTAHLSAFVIGGSAEFSKKPRINRIKTYKSKVNNIKKIVEKFRGKKGEKLVNDLVKIYGKKGFDGKVNIDTNNVYIKSKDLNIHGKRVAGDKWILIDRDTGKVMIAKWDFVNFRKMKEFNSYAEALKFLTDKFSKSVNKMSRKQAVKTLKERGLFEKYAKNLNELFKKHREAEVLPSAYALSDIFKSTPKTRTFEKYFSFKEFKEKKPRVEEVKTKSIERAKGVKELESKETKLLVKEKPKVEKKIVEVRAENLKRVESEKLADIKEREKRVKEEIQRKIDELTKRSKVIIEKPKISRITPLKFEELFKPKARELEKVKIVELEKPKAVEEVKFGQSYIKEEVAKSKEMEKSIEKAKAKPLSKSKSLSLVPIPLIPKTFGKVGGSIFKLSKPKITFKTKRAKYKPSLTAIGLKITSTKKPKELTGLELRPVIIKKKSKKKKKKKVS